MNDYRMNINVDIHDVDYNGVAKTSAILRYMQTAAQCQLTDNGMSYDQLKASKRAFVLSKLRLEIYKPLTAYMPLVAASYPCDSRGFTFLRGYTLEHCGEIVARAVSAWALIDTDNRSLVKVNDFELGLPTIPTAEIALMPLKLPVDKLADVGGYGVHYGDVDQNRHMNNTKYPNMYSNFLPLENKMISSISISYTNEAPMGEKMRVYRAEENGIYYFRTMRSDGKINSDAKIILSELSN